jgi:hypothetical protein
MKRASIWLLALVLAGAGASWAAEPQSEPGIEASARGQDIDQLLRGWPQASQKAGEAMIAKYGPPDEVTPTTLVWHDIGPWKRTLLFKEEVRHLFPKPHTDVLEQFVDYRVPLDLYDELARYDGSVMAERTKGELSARCDKEEMNFLALNLAHEIATGQRTVDDARRFYAQTASAFMAGQTDSPYIQGLLFSPQEDAADPDQPSSGP